MSSMKTKIFWIVFPLTVLAVSIFAINRADHSANRAQMSSPMQNAGESEAPPAPLPQIVTVPVDTPITVRLDETIATNQVNPGDAFYATVAHPVRVDGKTAIPAGSRVKGRVVSVHESGRLKGVAHLQLALNTVEVNGSVYDLHSNTCSREGKNHNKRNLAIIGGGSGGGALIGALAGGGHGALIGAPIGAAAGIAGAAATGKQKIVLPAETAMTFRLVDPVQVNL